MLNSDVRSAFVYAYPLYAVAETRFRAVQDKDNPHRHPLNAIRHNRDLSDHNSTWITAPNNDTLYSNAWLDLSNGPIRFQIGEMPNGRYWSLAFMDVFTNHFAVVGQRLDGTGPVDFTVVGPKYANAPPQGRIIQSPGDDAWLFCRCLVDGPDDLPQARAMQDKIAILSDQTVGSGERIIPVAPTRPENFLDVVNELLARNPVPGCESELLHRWYKIGIRPGVTGAWHEIGADAQCAWNDTIKQAFDELGKAGRKGRRNFRGWFAAASDIGNFHDNYTLRASVALGGLGALEPVEAMYFVKYHDENHESLHGTKQYLLKIPPSGIPTQSFWSFTMYEATADGRRFLVDNPISRYSLGNRTPGLKYNPDGSLDIALQNHMPTDHRLRANWLPTPTERFQIALRAYLPCPELRDGTTMLPTIVPVEN